MIMNSVSVITVVFQAAKTIERTIQSVLNQNYKNYEYILIDGASTDGTIELIEHYKRLFSDKGIRYTYISEPDKGIYDAMNKAVQLCNNDWIIYINANDAFYDENVLKKVFEKKYDEKVSCIYGTTINIKNGTAYYKKAYPIECITYRAPFIHQALFVKKDVLAKYPFNLYYKLAADFDQFVRMYVGKEIFQKIDVIVARFDLSGISQSCSDQVKEEWYKIWKENNLINQKKLLRWFTMHVMPKLKRSKVMWILYTKLLKGCQVLKHGKN